MRLNKRIALGSTPVCLEGGRSSDPPLDPAQCLRRYTDIGRQIGLGYPISYIRHGFKQHRISLVRRQAEELIFAPLFSLAVCRQEIDQYVRQTNVPTRLFFQPTKGQRDHRPILDRDEVESARIVVDQSNHTADYRTFGQERLDVLPAIGADIIGFQHTGFHKVNVGIPVTLNE